jgi:hypothetical protein
MQEIKSKASPLSKNISLPLKKNTSQTVSLGGVSALRTVDARKMLKPSGWIPRTIANKHLTDEQN